LWNGEDEAPDDVKTNRLVVTPGGHQLRFEDKDGDRRIVLETADGHQLTMDDKDKRITLATKDGGRVTLDELPGKAVVEASQNKITLAPSGITIEVNAGTLNISAPLVTVSGVVQVSSLIATSIVSTSYSPGLGNLL